MLYVLLYVGVAYVMHCVVCWCVCCYQKFAKSGIVYSAWRVCRGVWCMAVGAVVMVVGAVVVSPLVSALDELFNLNIYHVCVCVCVLSVCA